MNKQLPILLSNPRCLSDIFTDESRWIKGEYLVDDKGERCDSLHATKCCIFGGLDLLTSSKRNTLSILEKTLIETSIFFKTKHIGVIPLHEWNDNPARTFDELKEFVKKLDEELKSKRLL